MVVIWNKTGRSAQAIRLARQGGAAVIVAENGYHGTDENGIQRYALALDGHNGSGRWFGPDRSRLESLNIDFRPPITSMEMPVVIAGQRGIGSMSMRSPPNFHDKMSALLNHYGMTVRVRHHPGSSLNIIPPPMADELADCSAMVVWSSNCATSALIGGIPTFYAAPAIATAGAAKPYKSEFGIDLQNLIAPIRHDDAFMDGFGRMAWAQWTIAELTSGIPFQHLLDIHKGKLPYVGAWVDRA